MTCLLKLIALLAIGVAVKVLGLQWLADVIPKHHLRQWNVINKYLRLVPRFGTQSFHLCIVKLIKLSIMRNENRQEMKIHLDNFHIAGYTYWDGCEAFEHLKIGTNLDLVREKDNHFDPYAVAIYYKDLKLGYIPSDSNKEISEYLDMGWGDIYEVRVTRVSPDAHPETQVEVVVYIKRNVQK